MTLIKICGLTRDEDVALASQLGADFVGFIFVKESRRYVAPERVAGIRSDGPRRAGVFRNTPVAEIHRIAEVARLDVIQLHGDETEDDVAAIELPVIKAFNVRETIPETNTRAAYVMLDTGGGTGRTFDWRLLDTYERRTPIFLAGGITPDNVADAVRARPDGIDLAGGIESAPGIKDHDLMKRLFERVKR